MKKLVSIFVLLLAVMATSVSASRFNANVRVLHASPDAPDVDVLVDDEAALEDIGFKEITDYASLRSGRYNIKVVPAGASEPVVINADLRFRALRDYTVVALNNLEDIEAVVLEDNRRVSYRYADVRFFHASPDAPAVDIAVQDKGPVVFSDIEFKEYTDYEELDEGTYNLEVRVAGTDTVALELPPIDLEAGKAYTVFAVGTLAEGTLSALPVVDRETRAKRLLEWYRSRFSRIRSRWHD
jgi:hypothetical protein